MNHTGFDLVVPNYSPIPLDVESNPMPHEIPREEQFDEDFLCPCLPSCETITFIVSHTWDNLTELFFEVLYGDESDIEKDL